MPDVTAQFCPRVLQCWHQALVTALLTRVAIPCPLSPSKADQTSLKAPGGTLSAHPWDRNTCNRQSTPTITETARPLTDFSSTSSRTLRHQPGQPCSWTRPVPERQPDVQAECARGSVASGHLLPKQPGCHRPSVLQMKSPVTSGTMPVWQTARECRFSIDGRFSRVSGRIVAAFIA